VKAYLRNLIVTLLLFLPVAGRAAAPPSPSPVGSETAVQAAATAEQGPMAPVPETKDPDLQFPIFRTLGGLGIVVCLMVGAFFAAKKFAPRYFSKPSSERNLKIIETLSMGDRRSISLVEVASTRFLIGNTPHQINLLAALPEPLSLVSEPEKASAPQEKITRRESRTPFRSMFEVEKNRPVQYAASPLPDDLRTKMRQLRDALERS
jgi:flagellar biosynthetic protein FliO